MKPGLRSTSGHCFIYQARQKVTFLALTSRMANLQATPTGQSQDLILHTLRVPEEDFLKHLADWLPCSLFSSMLVISNHVVDLRVTWACVVKPLLKPACIFQLALCFLSLEVIVLPVPGSLCSRWNVREHFYGDMQEIAPDKEHTGKGHSLVRKGISAMQKCPVSSLKISSLSSDSRWCTRLQPDEALDGLKLSLLWVANTDLDGLGLYGNILYSYITPEIFLSLQRRVPSVSSLEKAASSECFKNILPHL